jgi:hypothetical protein
MFETETKTFLSYAVEKTHGRYTEETIFDSSGTTGNLFSVVYVLN